MLVCDRTENAVERRSLSELITLYQLEPSLRDVFVEGMFDRRLFSWVLRGRDRRRTHIYIIDEVDVPDAVLVAYGLRSGARSKVIALAKELDSALPRGSCQVTCVVDSNCEGALGISHECGRLLQTDYADLDGYLLTEGTIGRFLTMVFGLDLDPQGLLRTYFEILREPFLLRMAGLDMGINVARVDVTKSCRAEGDRIEFDSDDLTKRMLEKSSATSMLSSLTERVEELRSQLLGDARRYVNGHEFMDLFAWHWASEMRRARLRDFSALPYVLLNGVDHIALSEELLFSRLRERLES